MSSTFLLFHWSTLFLICDYAKTAVNARPGRDCVLYNQPMHTITCPRCGTPIPFRKAFSIGNKPFCARCGWNLARAEAAVAGKNFAVILVPFALAFLGAFAALTAKKSQSPFFFIFPLLFGVVVLIPVWSYYSRRRALAAAKLSVNPDLALAQPPLDPALQQLQALPRPRRVRFRFAGNLVAAATVFVLAFVIGLGVFGLTAARGPRTARRPAPTFPMFIPPLLMLTVFPVVILFPVLRGRRHIPLLRDGELALARVTSQQTIQQGKTSYSQIAYEFKTTSGQLVQNSVRDLTSSVFEDMTIPVFYDPTDPSKNVTPCATYFRILSSPY